jgi:hypothetical protein
MTDVSGRWVARFGGRLVWLKVMLNREQRQAAVLVMLNLGCVTGGGVYVIT